MIHYTLLPEQIIKVLKREYRFRVFTLLMLFISISIIIGIIALLPSFIFSYSQIKESEKQLESLQKSRESRGIDSIVKDLEETEIIVNKLILDDIKIYPSSILDRVLLYKSSSISITSFQIDIEDMASSSATAIIQGKSLTREKLLEFKKKLEQDSAIIDIEMPISDLAKEGNSPFAIRFKLKK